MAETIKQLSLDYGESDTPARPRDLLEDHAREKLGMPDEWKLYLYRVHPPPPAPRMYYELTGAVAPIANTGRPNWRRKDKATVRTAYIPIGEHEAWLAKWEETTGRCHNCQGSGQECAGWSAAEGAKYRLCSRCSASGKATGKGR